MILGIALTGCASGADDVSVDGITAPTAAPGDSESGDAEASDESRTPRGADLATTEFTVSWTEAVDSANANFDGALTEIELDWSQDRYAYKVELVSDSEEYELRVDADTGEQFGEHTEGVDADDVAEKQAETVDPHAVVPWEEALSAALDAHSGTVSEWRLEGTERGPEYSFDIDGDSDDDHEVSVDAETGKVTEVDD